MKKIIIRLLAIFAFVLFLIFIKKKNSADEIVLKNNKIYISLDSETFKIKRISKNSTSFNRIKKKK